MGDNLSGKIGGNGKSMFGEIFF